MLKPAPSNSSRLSAADLSKLKRYVIETLARGMESEGISFEQRS